MPLDPQQLDLYLGSNGGEATPADPQNIPLVFGLVPNFAEGAVTLLITAAGDGVRGVAGNGAVTLLFSAAGDGEHQTAGFEGDGQAALLITAAGVGAHGRGGYGEAFLTFGGAGAAVLGYGGTGDVTFNITAAGDGYLVPAGIGLVDLLTPAGAGQFLSLGFDPLKRRASGFRAPWGASKSAQPILHAPWVRTQRGDRDVRVPWAAPAKLDAERRYPWGLSREVDRDSRVPWGRYERKLQTDRRHPWGLSREADRDTRVPWGAFGRALQPEQRYPWGETIKADRDLRVPWGSYVVLQRETRIPWGGSKPVQWEQYIPWTKYSRTLDSGWGVVIPTNPGTTPGETITVPVQRVYIVQNQLLLIRTDNNATVPVLSMTLGLDYQSWAWSFTASMPRTALALIQPNVNGDPVILEAQINGTPFRVVIERVQRERSFGRESLRVSGRGITALLDEPYAPSIAWSNSGARTAQQLVNDALTFNAVPLGWTVNWGVTDWLVPAGQWSVQGPHMTGVLAVVNSIGAYLRPDTALDEFTVLNRYPVAPWDWASLTPDFVLPAAVTTQEGIEWIKRPDYNAVYVSGTTTGVLALVRRTGSAADAFAEMATDPLITHADAARQRGLAILGDTGRKALVSLRLPVLDETGVILPGQFVDYVDGATTRRGLVRGVQVSANSTVDVRQSLTVETNNA